MGDHTDVRARTHVCVTDPLLFGEGIFAWERGQTPESGTGPEGPGEKEVPKDPRSGTDG